MSPFRVFVGFFEVLGVLSNDVVGFGCDRTFVDAVVVFVAGDFQATLRLYFDAGGFQEAAQPGNPAAVKVL